MNSLLDKFLRWRRFREVVRYIPKDSIVCDIGCGSDAYFLKKISTLEKLKYGIGFDEKIENYKDSKFYFKKIRISKRIPLEKESCDRVVMLAVLEHLSNPQEILTECFRILKPAGKLILTTPTPLSKPILEFLAFQLRLIDKNEIEDHKNYFQPAEIREMLIGAGFREHNIKNYFFEFYLNNLIIAQK